MIGKVQSDPSFGVFLTTRMVVNELIVCFEEVLYSINKSIGEPADGMNCCKYSELYLHVHHL